MKMMLVKVFLAVSCTTLALAQKDADLGTRAASRDTNCGCQCSSLTFKDKYGKINGNCKSTDRTGAQWCYVDPYYNNCSDLKRSQRFDKYWSYEACATPEPNSYECANSGWNSGNNGGWNSGSNNGYPCRGSNCGSGSNNGGWSSGSSNNGGWNSGSSNNGYPCRGSNCGTGSIGGSLGGSSNGGYPCRGSNCGSTSLVGILGGGSNNGAPCTSPNCLRNKSTSGKTSEGTKKDTSDSINFIQ
eukprot:TRINITY_DN33024_c0_g1_i1.p1 TRINITY_DN33024_c0_g1~~TRINITY_DN33024_c0_g1_i1.p1  ORF type:complete len:243 (-),score=42.93 TRINITY_DN33024_c0_g1_i1:188-916(-)